MEPQERDLITTLLTRLQSASGQPKDPEADAMIRQAMTQMPDAPYYLVQTVLIQDLSLHSAQNRIADLEKQVASLAPPQQPTSFLGGMFGRSQPAQGSVPPSGPWTRAPQAAAAATASCVRPRQPRPASPAAPCCSRASPRCSGMAMRAASAALAAWGWAAWGWAAASARP